MWEKSLVLICLALFIFCHITSLLEGYFLWLWTCYDLILQSHYLVVSLLTWFVLASFLMHDCFDATIFKKWTSLLSFHCHKSTLCQYFVNHFSGIFYNLWNWVEYSVEYQITFVLVMNLNICWSLTAHSICFVHSWGIIIQWVTDHTCIIKYLGMYVHFSFLGRSEPQSFYHVSL